jgi:hypothetical protein
MSLKMVTTTSNHTRPLKSLGKSQNTMRFYSVRSHKMMMPRLMLLEIRATTNLRSLYIPPISTSKKMSGTGTKKTPTIKPRTLTRITRKTCPTSLHRTRQRILAAIRRKQRIRLATLRRRMILSVRSSRTIPLYSMRTTLWTQKHYSLDSENQERTSTQITTRPLRDSDFTTSFPPRRREHCPKALFG